MFRFVDVTYVCRDMLVCAVLGARLSFHIRDSSLSNICATVEVTYVRLSIVTKGHVDRMAYRRWHANGSFLTWVHAT